MYASSMHGESIYNIIPPKFVEQSRPLMYRSKFSGTLPASASTFHTQGNTTYPAVSNVAGVADEKVVADTSHRHFGKPEGGNRSYPDTYMKKFAKSSSVPSLAAVKRNSPELLQPSTLKPTKHMVGVPKATDRPVMNLVTSKNFIVANAVETILAAPKKVTQGAKDYLKKEDYGKVPKYLTHVKKDIEAETDYIRQMYEQQEADTRAPIHQMEEDERLMLIDGLKAKWEQINNEYQGQTHLTKVDTMGKAFRKNKWEAELAQIEKDIEKLNKRNICIDASM